MKHFIVTLSLIVLIITQSCDHENEKADEKSTQISTEKSVSSEQDNDVEPHEVCVLEGDGFIVSLDKNGKVVSRRGDKTTDYIDGIIKKGKDLLWENQNLRRFKVILKDGSSHIYDEGNPNEIVYENKMEIPHKETREEHIEKQNRLMKDPTLTANYNVLDTFQRKDNVVVLTKDNRLWYYNKATGHRAVFYSTNCVERVEWQSFEKGELLCVLKDGSENVVQVGAPFPITGTICHPYHKDPAYPSKVVIDDNAVRIRTCPEYVDECLLRDQDGKPVRLDKDTTLPYLGEVKGQSRKKSYYIVEYDGGVYYINQYYAYAE